MKNDFPEVPRMPRESGSEPSASGSGEGSCTFVLKLVFSLPC